MSDSDQQLEDDFEFSRRVYYALISKGLNQLDQAADLADQTQHPRSYEVVGNILKNVADINEKLLTLRKTKKDIVTKDQPKQLPQTNNNLFVGSTSELQKMLLNPPEAYKRETVIDSNNERGD